MFLLHVGAEFEIVGISFGAPDKAIMSSKDPPPPHLDQSGVYYPYSNNH